MVNIYNHKQTLRVIALRTQYTPLTNTKACIEVSTANINTSKNTFRSKSLFTVSITQTTNKWCIKPFIDFVWHRPRTNRPRTNQFYWLLILTDSPKYATLL